MKFLNIFLFLQGEVKQDSWVNQVRAAIKFVTEPKLKGLLCSIQGYTNIPRKEAKFINFLKNSLKIRDQSLCKKAWEAIKVEAEKLKNENEVKSEEVENEQKSDEMLEEMVKLEENEEENKKRFFKFLSSKFSQSYSLHFPITIK